MQIGMHLPARHNPAMDYKQASIDFLRHVVDASGKTPTELAKLVGKSPTTFTRPLSKADWPFAIKFDTLSVLSEKTGIPLPESLLDLRSEGAAQAPQLRLPIRYEVAASGFLLRDDIPQEPYGFIEVPSIKGFEGCPQWLERVISDSMDRLMPVGSIVHVADAQALRYRPKDGHVVIVERERGGGAMIERTIKQIVINGDQVELWPRSHNPRWQSPLLLTEGTDAGEEFTVQIVGRVLRSFQQWEA